MREISKRILELCKNKEFLKQERKKAKELRGKIVAVGNTMDSYGDKYIQQNFDNKTDNKSNEKKEDDSNYTSYDPYTSNKSL